MKKLPIVFFVLITLGVYASADAKHTKDVLKEAVKHNFPRAKNVHRFEKEGGFVEVDFMLKGSYVSTLYDASGKLIEANYSISFAELPERVKGYLAQEFKTLVCTSIVQSVHNSTKLYKVHFESGGVEYSLIATSSGQITLGY